VLDDLNQMEPKVLISEEQSVFAEGNITRQQQTETVLLGVK
jgi:hypothetical protein